MLAASTGGWLLRYESDHQRERPRVAAKRRKENGCALVHPMWVTRSIPPALLLVALLLLPLVAEGASLKIKSRPDDPPARIHMLNEEGGSIDLEATGDEHGHATLSCSGDFEASDIRVRGADMTMADMVAKMVQLLDLQSQDEDPPARIHLLNEEGGSIDLEAVEDEHGRSTLSCSGSLEASDVRIRGSDMTMVGLIAKVVQLEAQVKELRQRPSPPSQPSPPPPLSASPATPTQPSPPAPPPPSPRPRPPRPLPPCPSPPPSPPPPPPSPLAPPAPPAPPAAPPGDHVIFDGGFSPDLVVSIGMVGRVSGTGWNAAAWSDEDLWDPHGPRKGISFRCPDPAVSGRMLGFSDGSFDAQASFDELAYCIYCARHRPCPPLAS